MTRTLMMKRRSEAPSSLSSCANAGYGPTTESRPMLSPGSRQTEHQIGGLCGEPVEDVSFSSIDFFSIDVVGDAFGV